jgi:hypothetical protein
MMLEKGESFILGPFLHETLLSSKVRKKTFNHERFIGLKHLYS